MLRSHKIRLVPNQEQAVYFAKACGTERFAWNWALAVVGRFFPSSKTCSDCGAVNDKLTLADRRWTFVCGAEHDRDVNAAKNLLKRSIADAMREVIAASEKQTAGGGPVAACGEEGSGRRRKTAVKPASAKQEVKA